MSPVTGTWSLSPGRAAVLLAIGLVAGGLGLLRVRRLVLS